MAKKVYYLSTCDTCTDIIDRLGDLEDFRFFDIKEQNISSDDLDKYAKWLGSYEALFSKRARKYRSMGLKDKPLTEGDYRRLILDEYTFLKRPVIEFDGKVFAGNAPKTIEEVEKLLK